jgi:hypothetical protein
MEAAYYSEMSVPTSMTSNKTTQIKTLSGSYE